MGFVCELVRVTNTPRGYAWGSVDGIAHVLGTAGSGRPEAELWLGAHPLSPARRVGDGSWSDLAEWETATGRKLPFLLKVLAAAHPLSLQAHPTPGQAAEGFARENAVGMPLTAAERNYKDPYAKPELIVALKDGFEALCGFRPVAETLAAIGELAAASADPRLFERWGDLVATSIEAAFTWLLSGDHSVPSVVAVTTETARTDPRFELIDRLAAEYPGDPGILVAVMLNHVTLHAGEALWLPAGNIHAYLRGAGIELMGPSDNVLRGGLTPKHVDRDELTKILDFTAVASARLEPEAVAPHVVTYRPANTPSGQNVDFQLLLVTGDATIQTGSPAIALTVAGSFEATVDAAGEMAAVGVHRGDAVFIDEPAVLRTTGAGWLFIATGLGATA